MEVVEIDPQMTEIARRFFRLEENPHLKIIHEDGRVFLNRAEASKYDAVLMDAFGSLFSVPFQLTTVEAVREIRPRFKSRRRGDLQSRRRDRRRVEPFFCKPNSQLTDRFSRRFYLFKVYSEKHRRHKCKI